MGEREPERGRGAHREPAHDRGRPADAIEHGGHVRDERFGRVGARIVGRRTSGVPGRVVADDPPPIAERTCLRAEVARASRKAVREDDRRAAAVDVDVQIGHVDRI